MLRSLFGLEVEVSATNSLDTRAGRHYLLLAGRPRYDLAELLAKFTPGRRWPAESTPPGQLDLGDGDGDSA
ncbi:MAG: hypothetical protein IPF42_19920 [Candidatus Microthrix sp.]|nr:hypothetical protein [Candidatus Microthrix sp.]